MPTTPKQKKKERECYYPTCNKKGIYEYGTKNGYYLFCNEHFYLAAFIRDLYDYFTTL